MKVGENGIWQELRNVKVIDPECERMNKLSPIFEQNYNGVEIAELLGWTMDKPHISYHMWEGSIPPDLKKGTFTINVRTTDMYGQTWEAKRIIYVN